MPSKNPRINVVLEKPLYSAVRELAGREGLSMSMIVRDMVREEMEKHEDFYLSKKASERSGQKKKMIKHNDFWK